MGLLSDPDEQLDQEPANRQVKQMSSTPISKLDRDRGINRNELYSPDAPAVAYPIPDGVYTKGQSVELKREEKIVVGGIDRYSAEIEKK